jgi:hypothetical protein
MTGDEICFRVTFSFEYATVSTVVAVPVREEESDYSDDPSAIDVATDLLADCYGWDTSRAFDVDVELLEWVAR